MVFLPLLRRSSSTSYFCFSASVTRVVLFVGVVRWKGLDFDLCHVDRGDEYTVHDSFVLRVLDSLYLFGDD